MIDFAMRHAFTDLELDVRFRAEVRTLALFGDSGAGKTSVLNAIAGLLRPQQGRIVLDERVLFDSASGIDVPTAERRIGYVFQDGRLFPHLDARANLLYGARSRHADRRWRFRRDRRTARARAAARAQAAQSFRRRAPARRDRPRAAGAAARVVARRAVDRPPFRGTPSGARTICAGSSASSACSPCWSRTMPTKSRRWPTRSCCSRPARPRGSFARGDFVRSRAALGVVPLA